MSKYKNHLKRDDLKKIKDCHLRNLKVFSTDEINSWFLKAKENNYLLKGIDKVVSILKNFKEKTVFIFGDYDADGITGSAIYVRGLKFAGFKDVHYMIPKRIEGFGFNKRMIDDVIEYLKSINSSPADCAILTVDNGTAAVSAAAYAKEKGFTLLITDHHEPYEENGKVILPESDVTINANAIANSATFNGCCGAGVAFKVMSHLLENKNQIALLRPLAMVGTFCDVMDLIEENYVIAYYGLKTLNEHLDYNIPAFKAMAKVLGIAHWDGGSIGFKFGPCINALERLEDGAAKLGVQLLTSNDYDECLELSRLLVEYNERRKIESEEGWKLVEEEIQKMPEGPGYPIVLYVPGIKPGIVGILAGKLQEKYKAPAGVFSDGLEGTVKGSFRSPEGFNIKEHLDMVQSYFEHVGGHAGAAGASIQKDKFNAMVKALQETVPHIETVEEDTNYYYDIEITNQMLPLAIAENEKFQPLGKGNEDLKFKVTGFKLLPYDGKYYKEIKKNGIQFKSEISGAVGFDLVEYAKKINSPCSLTLYGNIANNYWVKSNNEVVVTPQVIFDDFEFEESTVVKSSFAQRLESKASARK